MRRFRISVEQGGRTGILATGIDDPARTLAVFSAVSGGKVTLDCLVKHGYPLSGCSRHMWMKTTLAAPKLNPHSGTTIEFE